jgi:hypothetical protein
VIVRSIALGAIAAVLLCGAANAAQFVVVEARGIGMKPGTVLDPSKPLSLKQGQHVTLISDSGVTLKLDGPYEKAPSVDGGKGVDLASTLRGLVTERQARLTEVGTTRGKNAVKLPDAWVLDSSHGGTVCLLEGQAPVFWRPDSGPAIHFAVMPADRSWRADATWPAGTNRIAVSTPVVLHGDAAYFLSYNGTEQAITISTIPASLPNDRMRAAWMAEKGCEAQAEALVRSGS